ncbi:RICIN domain-containing protein, partial [Actinoplanes sp. NPDC049596]|uniref:RICIN domain-containing protein n=1 Tax=Actinoplanes sp. NPDC049596 TaxID=3154625 RepID=UPI00342BAA01
MRTQGRFGVRVIHAFAALLTSLTVVLAVPAHAAVADGPTDTWTSDGRLDDGLGVARLDRCRLGFVNQAGGPAIRAVAQAALNGTDAQMHTAADPDYWDDTPLSVAYKQDDDSYLAKMDQLYARKDVWSNSIPNNFEITGETTTGFQWAPDFYGDLGISSFYGSQFFADEERLYADLEPLASAESLTTATDLAKQKHYYVYDGGDAAGFRAWSAVGDSDPFNSGSVVFHGNHHADDIREWLQFGGWPSAAIPAGSAEFRQEVETLKQRFSSCDADNPLDPRQVLAPVVKTAAAEWQAELDSQKSQRSAILAAQSKAYTDLENAAIAMGEAVGQSWIARQLSRWQACWTAGGECTAGSGPMTVKYKANTGLCLDNAGSSTAANGKVQLYTCNNSNAQKWAPSAPCDIMSTSCSFTWLNAALRNGVAGRCLDLNGTNVVQNACTTNKATQRWQYTTTGGQTRLFNVGAQKCLDSATATSGLQATVQACNAGTTRQQFVTAQNNAGTSTGTDSMFAPKAADFTYAVNEIKNAQNRAAAQLTIANNASADAQAQATAVTNAQAAATTIATTSNYPVGRGLAYAQQSAQVTKASAAGAVAAAKATATAVQATKASVADSATLVTLAQTQAKAMQAEYAKTAAQEAARQAKAAATSAAAEAKAAADAAAVAKAKRAEAEKAKATAQTAADKAAAQRKIAEQQRQVAANQRAIAASKHQEAAAADADAQRQQTAAATARADAERYESTAADRDHDAQTAANGAHIARLAAETARDKHDALASRAEALQAKADSLEGTSQAGEAREAANNAQAAADRADAAADQAERDADIATQAAQEAREAATRAHAA